MLAVKPVSGFLSRLSDSGKDLWQRQFGEREQSTITLCRRLIELRGEASSVLVADEIIKRLDQQTDRERLGFFTYLLTSMQPEEGPLTEAASAYLDDPTPQNASALSMAAKPPRKTLFRMLSMSPRGAQALVKLREHLRRLMKEYPELKHVDHDLVDMFRSWFSRGFLELREISWTTPAHVLEKLIAYEAVHEIRGWDDLRRRLASDRRCYGFFHPALKDEPLIFVEVALLDEMASDISAVIQQEPQADAAPAQTAIFYSISNCQPGLAGVSFGNFLIKQVVKVLQAELPNLKTFATLSPVPGFSRWVEKAGIEENLEEADDQRVAQLCAHYLVNEKRGEMPLDPVARFHLGNGARLERLNPRGDISEHGMAQAYGMLVNYVYDLPRLERNHEALVNEGIVSTTPAILKVAHAAGLNSSNQTKN